MSQPATHSAPMTAIFTLMFAVSTMACDPARDDVTTPPAPNKPRSPLRLEARLDDTAATIVLTIRGPAGVPFSLVQNASPLANPGPEPPRVPASGAIEVQVAPQPERAHPELPERLCVVAYTDDQRALPSVCVDVDVPSLPPIELTVFATSNDYAPPCNATLSRVERTQRVVCTSQSKGRALPGTLQLGITVPGGTHTTVGDQSADLTNGFSVVALPFGVDLLHSPLQNVGRVTYPITVETATGRLKGEVTLGDLLRPLVYHAEKGPLALTFADEGPDTALLISYDHTGALDPTHRPRVIGPDHATMADLNVLALARTRTVEDPPCSHPRTGKTTQRRRDHVDVRAIDVRSGQVIGESTLTVPLAECPASASANGRPSPSPLINRRRPKQIDVERWVQAQLDAQMKH